jgi:transposase
MYDIFIILTVLKLFKNTNLSNRAISIITKISRQTINRWKNTFYNDFILLIKHIYSQKTLNNICIKKEENKNKFYKNINISTYFDEIVKKNPFYTRKQYATLISEKFNIKFTVYNVTLLIKRYNYSYKKPRKYTVKNKEYLDELEEKRKIFQEKIKLEIQSKIIAIDESGFNKLINYLKGLSKKGKALNIPNTQDSKNISLLMAIVDSKIFHYTVSEQKINGSIYIDFIKQIINKLDTSGYIFLMDNVSFHHNKELIKIIKDSGNSIMYTPPYSPNNNPIENLFSVVKNTYYKLDKTIIINKDQICNDYYTYDYDYNNYTLKKKKRKRKVNKIKYFIIITIQQLKQDLDTDYFNSIFKRAINFNHDDLTAELRDRLIIN